MANQPTEIDPKFFLPPFVVDLSYGDDEDVSTEIPAQEGDEVEVEVEVIDGGGDEGRLLPPDYIVIVSQTTRVHSGGAVVDVVIDVEDAPRVAQYDVRVTK